MILNFLEQFIKKSGALVALFKNIEREVLTRHEATSIQAAIERNEFPSSYKELKNLQEKTVQVQSFPITRETDEPYSKQIHLLVDKLNFALIKSKILERELFPAPTEREALIKFCEAIENIWLFHQMGVKSLEKTCSEVSSLLYTSPQTDLHCSLFSAHCSAVFEHQEASMLPIKNFMTIHFLTQHGGIFFQKNPKLKASDQRLFEELVQFMAANFLPKFSITSAQTIEIKSSDQMNQNLIQWLYSDLLKQPKDIQHKIRASLLLYCCTVIDHPNKEQTPPALKEHAKKILEAYKEAESKGPLQLQALFQWLAWLPETYGNFRSIRDIPTVLKILPQYWQSSQQQVESGKTPEEIKALQKAAKHRFFNLFILTLNAHPQKERIITNIKSLSVKANAALKADNCLNPIEKSEIFFKAFQAFQKKRALSDEAAADDTPSTEEAVASSVTKDYSAITRIIVFDPSTESEEMIYDTNDLDDLREEDGEVLEGATEHHTTKKTMVSTASESHTLQSVTGRTASDPKPILKSTSPPRADAPRKVSFTCPTPCFDAHNLLGSGEKRKLSIHEEPTSVNDENRMESEGDADLSLSQT